MAGNNFTALTSATYDTSAPLFGTADLTGAYGNSATGAGGISGPTGLSAVGWAMDFAANIPSDPSSTIVLAGYNNTPSYSNAFYIGVTAAGFLTAVVWDSTGSGATGAHTYTGTTSVLGTYQRLAISVTSGTALILQGGAVVATLTPNSGKNFATCIPPNVSLGNFYGTPTFPATGVKIDEVAIWPTAKYTSGGYTPLGAAYVGTEGMNVLLHLDSTLTDSSVGANVTIAPNNAAIVYSPYNWLVGSGAAETINPGAYFKTCFTGSSITLNFNVTNNATPVPQLWYSIDGQPYIQIESLAATEALTMPTTTTAWALHTLLVVVKSTSEFVTRWTPQDAAVILTSITLANGATVSVPSVFPANILIYGDSITEGYHTVNSNGSGTNDCDGSDSTLAYSCLESPLGSEVGVVGFGGQRLAITGGQGGVPALITSYNLLWSGQARTFTPAPNLILINIGTNDFTNGVSQATYQAAMITLLDDLLAACPSSKIAVMQPFQGWGTTFTPTMLAQCTAAIQAAIASVGSGLISYISTTGMFTSANPSVDGVHPLGVTTISSILPQLVPLIQPLLQAPGRSYVFTMA